MLTSFFLNVPKKKLQNAKLVVTFSPDSVLVIRRTGSDSVEGREIALASFAPLEEGEGVAVEPTTDPIAAKVKESTEVSTTARGDYPLSSRVNDIYTVDPSFIRVYAKEDVAALKAKGRQLVSASFDLLQECSSRAEQGEVPTQVKEMGKQKLTVKCLWLTWACR